MNNNQDPTTTAGNVIHNQSRDFMLFAAPAGELEGERLLPAVTLGETTLRVSFDEQQGTYLIAHPEATTQTLRDANDGNNINLGKMPLGIGSKVGTKLTIGRSGVFITEPNGEEIDVSDQKVSRATIKNLDPSVSRKHITFEVIEGGLRYTDSSLNGTKFDDVHSITEPETHSSNGYGIKTVGNELDSTRRTEMMRTVPEVGIAERALKGEDAVLNKPTESLFGVFDGAGGHGGGQRAAEVALGVFYENISRFTHNAASDRSIAPDMMRDFLRASLVEADKAVEQDQSAGFTTGVVAKLMPPQGDDGSKYLVWASVGDSRIYAYNRQQRTIVQLSVDEGEGRYLDNALGASADVKQASVYKLHEGDEIILCSDGITGDKGDDLMLDDELNAIMSSSNSVTDAAEKLLQQSRKSDDKSVLVIKP